jgi:hypothetical protein
VPGLYINDGGETASALGKVLGGIASNYDPKTIAEAQALRYRTEGEDIANQKAAEALQALQNATNQGPAALGQAGGLPGAGGVADTAASLAVPPLVGAYRHPAGTALTNNPFGAQVQNWIQSGQATPEAWKGSILPVGQTMTTGPGTDYNTQTEIAKERQLPVTITAGQTRIQNPAAAAGGSGVLQGPSTYTQTGEQAGAGADDALASKDLEIGAAAKTDLGRAELIDQLYSRLDELGANNPGAVAKDLGVQALSQKLGVDLSRFTDAAGGVDIAAMKNEIRTLGLGLTGSLRTTQGDPMPRGSLEAIQAMAADPNTPPAQFHRMISVIKSIAQGQADNFDAALEFRKNRPKLGEQAAIDYHTKRGQNAATQGNAIGKLGPSDDGGGGGKPVFVQVPDQAHGEALGPNTYFQLPDGSRHKNQ